MIAAVFWGCTGTPAAPPVEETEPVPVIAPTPVRPLAIPTTPPLSGDPIAGGGVKDVPPAGAPPADARDFQPVSIPQGPRETGGVRWENVSSPPTNPVNLGDGEVYDPTLKPASD